MLNFKIKSGFYRKLIIWLSDRYGEKMPGKTAALEQLLLNGIQAGKWRVGEAIPSRNSLMRKYRLSRCTVERAVGGLIRAGILTAKQGGVHGCGGKAGTGRNLPDYPDFAVPSAPAFAKLF